jgi:sporulation-control protein spo0M
MLVKIISALKSHGKIRANRVDEVNVAYYGEPEKLNVVFEITRRLSDMKVQNPSQSFYCSHNRRKVNRGTLG